MDGEDPSKQPSRRIPLTRLEQVQSDLALAITLQEQEREMAFTTRLTTIESTSEEDDDEDSYHDDDADEYFESQAIQAELEFLEGEEDEEEEEEDSSSSGDDIDDEEMDEYLDDLDPDELSYEELIAIGEFIGEEKRGLSISDIPTCLRACKCLSSVETKTGVIDRCVVCQVEYEEGEALVALPCEHPFHSECITKWLQIRKICPICSTEVSSPKGATSYL